MNDCSYVNNSNNGSVQRAVRTALGKSSAIMRKAFKLDEIDCANCARELQEGIAKLEGVKSVSVNFMTQKLTLEADDAEFDEVLERVVAYTEDVEPDCEIIR